MAKNKVSDWSSTPANNTDIANIDIAEGCSPSGINNAIREMMSQIKDWQSGNDSGEALAVASGGTGAETAADARTNLSAAKSGANSDITSLSGLTTPLSVTQGGTGVQVTRTISNVALTSNVVTITTSEAHGYLVNDSVTVTATTQTTVNGSYTIASVPTSTTFTYAKTASNIPSASDTGSVVSASNIKMSAASGILPVTNGGTGANTLKANNLLVGNGTSAPSVIPAGTTGNVLVSSATSTVTAGSFAVGTEYTIVSIGTTDFTAIGAASNTVGVVFTATGVGSGSGTATTNTWGSGTYTPPALSTASGSAPSYSARAFVVFDGTVSNDLSYTYSQVASTTVTFTLSTGTHNFVAGNRVYINFTSGTLSDGVYTIASVADTTHFTITYGSSGTTSGAATVQGRSITNGKNVNYVSYIGTGNYLVNFTTAMASSSYCPIVSGNASQSRVTTANAVQAGGFQILTEDAGGTDTNSVIVSAVVFE